MCVETRCSTGRKINSVVPHPATGPRCFTGTFRHHSNCHTHISLLAHTSYTGTFPYHSHCHTHQSPSSHSYTGTFSYHPHCHTRQSPSSHSYSDTFHHHSHCQTHQSLSSSPLTHILTRIGHLAHTATPTRSITTLTLTQLHRHVPSPLTLSHTAVS